MRKGEVTPSWGLTARVRIPVGRGQLQTVHDAVENDPVAGERLDLHDSIVVPLRSETQQIDGEGWIEVAISGWMRSQRLNPAKVAVGASEASS